MINPLLVIRQSLPWRERAALRGRVMANGEGWDFRMTSDEACQVFIWGYLRQSGRHWLAALLQAPRLVPRNMYALAGDTILEDIEPQIFATPVAPDSPAAREFRRLHAEQRRKQFRRLK